MDNPRKKIVWFPKETSFSLRDVYGTLFFFGAFGIHQFYLGNNKKGALILAIFSLSHLQIAFIDILFPFLYLRLGITVTLCMTLSGYALGLVMLLWDLATLPTQVRRVNKSNLRE